MLDDSKQPDVELAELAAAECDGVLTDAEWQRLTQILRGDPQARQQYVEFKVLHALLAAKQVSPLEQHAKKTAQSSATWLRRVARATDDSPSRKRSLAPRRVLRRVIEDFAQQPLAAVLLCGAIVAAALVAWQMPRAQQGNVARDAQDNVERDGIQADRQQRDAIENDRQTEHIERTVIARLGRTHEAEWGNKQAAREWSEGGVLAQGDRLVLKRGLAEIVYDTGATVLLEGPAELEIGGTRQAAANACSLALGKLVARVPESAHGFTVVTPTLTIIDKGTEFGVLVKNKDEGGRMKDEKQQIHPSSFILPPSVTEVQVIAGRVVVEQQVPLPEPPQAQPTPEHVAQVPRPKQIELSAGEGVVAEPNTEAKKTTDATRTTFVRSLPAKTPLLPLATWPADSPLKPGDIVAVSNAKTKFHLFKIDPHSGEQKLLATGIPHGQGANDHGLEWSCVAVEPDGNILVGAKGLSAWDAGLLRIDPRNGEINVVTRGGLLKSEGIMGLAVASDGTIYAAYKDGAPADSDFVLRIDPASGKITPLARFGAEITGLCLDVGGRDLLASSSKDATVGMIPLTSDPKVTPWAYDRSLGQFDCVAVDHKGHIFVGAVEEKTEGGEIRSHEQKILEVSRSAQQPVRTLAVISKTRPPWLRMSIACEADGNLVVHFGGDLRQVDRIDTSTGKVTKLSGGGLIETATFLAVVPGKATTNSEEAK